MVIITMFHYLKFSKIPVILDVCIKVVYNYMLNLGHIEYYTFILIILKRDVP
jgi:hypothetical protein